MTRRFLLVVCMVMAASGASARHPRRAASGGTFDYYLLSLSWAPNYCHDHPNDHSSECRKGGRQGFVLHGLWPQSESGPPPMTCGPAGPLADSLLDSMLQYFPSRGLIQHEWEEHGTCSGLSADDYFHQAAQAFQQVQVPEPFRNVYREQYVSLSDLERRFAEANHAPAEAVHASCHEGELVNLEICLSKNLQFRSCSASVRDCPASQVSLLPPE